MPRIDPATGERINEESSLAIDPKTGERVRQPLDSSAVALAATAKVIPTVANAAMEVATNPSVPRSIASVGRVVGGMTPAIGGVASGNPLAAVNGVLGASQGAWGGGKAGWFTGKLLQNMTAPIAKALETVTPYLQTMSTLSGAQGINDLAQMADPKRQDIGVMGIGASTPHDDAHPALLNLLTMKATDAISALMKTGVSLGEATRAYWNLKAHVAKAESE